MFRFDSTVGNEVSGVSRTTLLLRHTVVSVQKTMVTLVQERRFTIVVVGSDDVSDGRFNATFNSVTITIPPDTVTV